MKKIKTLITWSFMALMIVLVSCSGADMKAINEKFEKEGVFATFTQKEYAAMVDYMEKNFEKYIEEITKSDQTKIDETQVYDWINYNMVLGLADDEGKLDKSTSAKYKSIITKWQNKVKETHDYEF